MSTEIGIGVGVGFAILALVVISWLLYRKLRQRVSSDEEYDFHGMTVREAMAISDKALGSDKRRVVRFITGRGLHSANGVPVIKNALERDLNQRGIAFTHEHKGGVVVVDMRNSDSDDSSSCIPCLL